MFSFQIFETIALPCSAYGSIQLTEQAV